MGKWLDSNVMNMKPHPFITLLFLTGHEFKLEYDNDVFEYTYTPVNPAPSLKDTDDLSEVLCFPDYMLPRFLIKLLSTTYEDNTGVSPDIVSDD